MELQQAEQQLLEQLLNDPSLTGLLEKCAELLGSPLGLILHGGEDGYILSEGYPAVDVVLGHMALEKHNADTEEAFHRYLEQVEAEHGASPFFLPGKEGIMSRLLCLVKSEDQRIGLLSLPEGELPLEEVSRQLMRVCARCIGLRFSHAIQNEDVTSIRRGMFFLLTYQNVSYNDILGMVGPQTPLREGDWRLLIIRALEEGRPQGIGALAGQIARVFSSRWYSSIKNEGAVLFRDSALTPEAAGEIPRLLALEDCSACLSPVYRDLMETALWRRRLNILPAFRAAAPGTVTRYDDWLDWGIFGETNLSAGQLAGFIPSAFRAMRDWDRDHGTAYVPTLSAFISHWGRRRETAAALKTHVNTLIYRLQKMEELFGLDFDAPETLGSAVFAIRLMEYLDRME